MKEIKVRISEKDMDAIEDAFFTDLSKKQYLEIKPRLVRIWERLCKELDFNPLDKS